MKKNVVAKLALPIVVAQFIVRVVAKLALPVIARAKGSWQSLFFVIPFETKKEFLCFTAL